MQIFGRAAQRREEKALWGLEPPGFQGQKLMEMHINRGLLAATWEWGWQDLTPWINNLEVDGSILLPGWKEKGKVQIHIPALLRGRGER